MSGLVEGEESVMADRNFRGRSRSIVVAGQARGRLTEWIGSTPRSAPIALAANTFVLDQLLGGLGLAKRPFTITRTVGTIFVLSDQTAARETPFGAMGMMVVSEKAATTGATAVPDPVNEISSDEWFVYQAFAALGTGSVAEPPLMAFPFDSRAQRKVPDGATFVVVIANESAADGLLYMLRFRMLLKLS